MMMKQIDGARGMVEAAMEDTDPAGYHDLSFEDNKDDSGPTVLRIEAVRDEDKKF